MTIIYRHDSDDPPYYPWGTEPRMPKIQEHCGHPDQEARWCSRCKRWECPRCQHEEVRTSEGSELPSLP